MVALLCFVMAVLAAPFKSKSHLEAENAALRHQLIILRRKVPGRVQLTNNDRWFFIQLYIDGFRRFCSSCVCRKPHSRRLSSLDYAGLPGEG